MNDIKFVLNCCNVGNDLTSSSHSHSAITIRKKTIAIP